MDENPVLIAREGELTGQRWTVQSNDVLIGRGGDCDIILPERQVSRHHARIRKDDGAYFLQDLGSKNGTHINGQQIKQSASLQDGDEIQIALCVKLLFVGTEATVPLAFAQPESTGSLVLDSAARAITIKGETLEPPLSLAQFRLLRLLYEADGAVCGRDRIIEVVWPGTHGIGVTEQAIDALVRRLRDRLAELDDHNYIVTVRGHGFRLDNE